MRETSRASSVVSHSNSLSRKKVKCLNCALEVFLSTVKPVPLERPTIPLAVEAVTSERLGVLLLAEEVALEPLEQSKSLSRK